MLLVTQKERKKRQIHTIILLLKHNVNKEILPKEASTDFSNALDALFH